MVGFGAGAAQGGSSSRCRLAEPVQGQRQPNPPRHHGDDRVDGHRLALADLDLLQHAADGAGISASLVRGNFEEWARRARLYHRASSAIGDRSFKMLSPSGHYDIGCLFRLLEAYSETLDAVRRQDSCQVPGTPCTGTKHLRHGKTNLRNNRNSTRVMQLSFLSG